jgi:alanine racemase
MSHQHRLWAEINLDYLKHNFGQVKKLVKTSGADSLIMAVVKADAYGHGVIETARALVDGGADRLAVSNLDEALQLRHSGFQLPIQILSYTFPSGVEEIVRHNLIQTVYDVELASKISRQAAKSGVQCRIHIKLDTGMTRLGMPDTEDSIRQIKVIYKLPNIFIEGIMTHFAVADTDAEATEEQFRRFSIFYCKLEQKGICIPIRHVANSAAVMRFPNMHLEMIRPGIMLYGLYPDQTLRNDNIALKPVMSLKAKTIKVNIVPANVAVSYGRKFMTDKASRLVTIPAGYADGYSRTLSGQNRIILKGRYIPIVGNICMDHFMADATDIEEDILVGDEIIIIGEYGNRQVSAEELAAFLGTINYELVCRIGMRVPRVYMKNGVVRNSISYIGQLTAPAQCQYSRSART